MPQEDSTANTLGAIGGIAGGPIGQLAGQVIGTVAGWLGGGGVPYGTNEFDGLHSPTLPELSASSMKVPECGIYAQYARALGISVEEVDLVFQLDSQQSGHSMQYVLDAYRALNLQQFQNWLALYNRTYPAAAIRPGEKGPRSASGGPSYSGATQPIPTAPSGGGNLGASTVALANSFLGLGGSTTTPVPPSWQDSIKDILNAGLQGGIKGATDKAMETPQGMKAKSEGFKSFLKDNQLIVGGVGALFLWALAKAFKIIK